MAVTELLLLLLLFIAFSACSSSWLCSAPLGMENGQIKDAQITASSQYHVSLAAIQARLNFKADWVNRRIHGGWSASSNNINQWIQVDLARYTVVTGVATQGRNARSQWVTAYTMQYSGDGVTFKHYKVPGQSSPKQFSGNVDSDSIVYHKLNPPIKARYIRLRPTAWYGHISMRMELYGCLGCSAPMGMESGQIKDDQITASSQHDVNHAAIQGRLNFKARGAKQGGWSSLALNVNQWIQVDLGRYTVVKGIATQGRNGYSQWVTAYNLQSSDDGVNFHYYGESSQSSPKVFNGNVDRDTIVYHELYPPIQARFIRHRPTAWYGYISLRMELYGCLNPGIRLHCNSINMTILIPKSLLLGINHKHLRLLDTKCKAEETRAYYTLTTPLTGCKTKRRHTPSAVAYSNKVLRFPATSKDPTMRKVQIQFSCLYSKNGVVSSFGWSAIHRKVIVSNEHGKGNLTLALNMFPDEKFASPYKENDFPVLVEQKRLFLEVSVTSNDKRLSIIADRCYTTPTPDRENPSKYEFITKGCPADPTVNYYLAPSVSLQRFSLETSKFVADSSVVFVHCNVIVCNATDPDSQCAKQCPSSRRGKREVSGHVNDNEYSLAQGPLLLVRDRQEEARNKDGDRSEKNGPNMTFVVSLVMMCFGLLVAAVAGLIIFKKLRVKRSAAGFSSGEEK